MEATQVSINRWMDKDVVYVYVYTHTMEYYSAIKNEILPFTEQILYRSFTSLVKFIPKYCIVFMLL